MTRNDVTNRLCPWDRVLQLCPWDCVLQLIRSSDAAGTGTGKRKVQVVEHVEFGELWKTVLLNLSRM